ncbi:MAG: hypothetical protein MUQ65_16145, partial [Armatimonadetes bacterium]|nr:hypothetical protein [Armatimonadota bacterium]
TRDAVLADLGQVQRRTGTTVLHVCHNIDEMHLVAQRVAVPNARGGIIAGAILTWARAFGIFGPLMVFVGAVRMRTEVLPTAIYLEASIGRIEIALAVALLMIAMAGVALILIRLFGGERNW